MTRLPPPLSLETVAEALNAWRRHRHGRQVPTPLRRQVVALLEHYAISHVINALALNHTTVKRWQRELGETVTDPALDPTFVPLMTAVDAPGPTPSRRPALTLTWTDADGAHQLSGQLTPAQWQRVITALWVEAQ